MPDEKQELKEDALEHGAVRADQGFDISEVVREYRTLRNVLLTVLEPDLKTGSVAAALQAVRKIGDVLDKAVLLSMESYVAHRLELLEQMHGQLLLTNQELIRLVQMQKDNVSHLAHELKNPLNSIIGFSSLLLRKQQKQLAEQPAKSLEIQQIERILSNGQQLLRLINNALEIARQESESLTLKVEPVKVSLLVKTVVESLEPSALEKQLKVSMDCDRALCKSPPIACACSKF